jgi:valyl-tRNA synthetase
LSPDDQYILQRLQDTVAACDENLERCRFNDVAHVLYEFIWHQFCDWYVEYSKSVLYGTDPAARGRVLEVMHYIFSNALRLLHPVMPFVTEEIWHTLGYGSAEESISRAAWPTAAGADRLAAWGVRPAAVSYVEDKYDLIRAGRQLRSDYSVPPSKKIEYIVKPVSGALADALRSDMDSALQLLRASAVRVDVDYEPIRAMPSGISRLGSIFMPVEGLIDVSAEIERLKKQKTKIGAEIERMARKLDNQEFIRKAPPEVVEQFVRSRQDLVEQDLKYTRLIEGLAG